jgi:hypothetical protein
VRAGPRSPGACGPGKGGWAPLGWLVESPDGKRTEAAPWLAEYGLAECPEPGFPARTRVNVRDSDATLWLGDYHSLGGRATLDACRTLGRPFLIVFQGVTRPSQVAEWIRATNVRVRRPGQTGC